MLSSTQKPSLSKQALAAEECLNPVPLSSLLLGVLRSHLQGGDTISR